MVSRHSVSYLIGRVEGYADARQFALHRIEAANCLDEPAREPAGFDVDDYIQKGGFNNPGPVGQQALVADVAPQVAWLLRETPLSAEQSLKPLPKSDWQRLRAEVPDDQETLWWLFGLGEHVRIHAPKSWILAIKTRAESMVKLYSQPHAPAPAGLSNHPPKRSRS
jgi:predicted DNA-binding transcriptional regulator YafY